ncbi:E3 UBIQUITIN-PROTEIN LIGASE RMA1 [Salix koriyanagi]|uniref:E3 ubiquitin-protein ligase RMA n=1 Tax=Salix koriyanagi TaxID=2511006 RepID=A0A9Q0W786_9ROSI|nr:E3 UBIQUITIN-PROTEIN LIGASE RMA1 [Salix koriyanagi]
MATEQYPEGTVAQNDYNREDKPSLLKWKPIHKTAMDSDDSPSNGFDCNICLDSVQDPVVTLCGATPQKPSDRKAPNLGIIIPQRPPGLACGFDSPRTPLATESPRPIQQIHHRHNYPHQSQLYYSQPGSYAASPMLSPGGTAINTADPVVGMFGEMIYARVFGNSITNMQRYPDSYHLAASSSPRVRRHVMQADRSLSRISFFLFCCVFLCLLSF